MTWLFNETFNIIRVLKLFKNLINFQLIIACQNNFPFLNFKHKVLPIDGDMYLKCALNSKGKSIFTRGNFFASFILTANIKNYYTGRVEILHTDRYWPGDHLEVLNLKIGQVFEE